MSSVFTHQKPYVKWPNRVSKDPKCELADLLVAVIDRTGKSENIAILLQAKIASAGVVALKIPGEKKQFDLLSARPVFDVVKAHGPTQVDLKKYSPDSALMYGLASKYFMHNKFPPSPYCGWETWFATDDLSRSARAYKVDASDTLASVLVGMLQGNYGWPFDLAPMGKDWTFFAGAASRNDWSMLINYLLEETFAQPMKSGLDVPGARITRGGEDKMFLKSFSPQNAQMFCVLDGFNHSSINSHFETNEVNQPKWTSSTYENFFIDGGGMDGGNDSNPDEPEDGPISALIIELGRPG